MTSNMIYSFVLIVRKGSRAALKDPLLQELVGHSARLTTRKNHDSRKY